MAQELMAIGKGIGGALPALFAPDARAAERTIEFFAAQIRNLHTRKAYAREAGEFSVWCAEHGIVTLGQVRPVHIAAYVEGLQHEIAAPSVKLRLAAIRMLFDWLVVSQVVPVNPASSVRGPKHGEHTPFVLREGRSSVSSFRRCFWAGIQLLVPVRFKNTGFRPKLVPAGFRPGTCRNDVCSVRTHSEQYK